MASTSQSNLVPILGEDGNIITVEADGKFGSLFFNPQTGDQVLVIDEPEENIAASSSCAESSSQGRVDFSEIIWASSRKRSLPVDDAAVESMLQIYGSEKYRTLFNDKKSVKKHLWQSIAKQMLAEGFNFGINDVAVMGNKCDQKWRNLERTYSEFIKRSSSTGNQGGLKPPPHYETIHAILGTRHANAPVRILESTEAPAEENTSHNAVVSPQQIRRPLKELRKNQRKEEEENVEEKGSDEEEPASNPYMAVKRSTRPNKKPKVSNSQIIEKMEELHKKEMEAQENQFRELSQHLGKSAEQRDRLLDILSAAFKPSAP